MSGVRSGVSTQIIAIEKRASLYTLLWPFSQFGLL